MMDVGSFSRGTKVLALLFLGSVIAAWAGWQPLARAESNTNSPASQEPWDPAGGPTNDPWSQIEQFHNRMDQLFSQGFNQSGGSIFSVPNVDLSDEKDHYKVVMDMPGADKGSINVHVEGRVLSISSKRETSAQGSKDDRVLRDERGEASFERILTLPGPVNATAVKTDYANGVLTIILPKSNDKNVESVSAPPIQPAVNTPGFPAGTLPNLWAGTSGDPLSQIEQLHNRMDQLFSDTFSQSDLNGFFKDGAGGMIPSLDLRDEKDHYEVRMDMPGADKTSLKVKVQGRYLSVSGQRDLTKDTPDSGQVLRNERSLSQFERSITLPGPVKVGAVDAHYDNGVLTLRLPKDTAETSPVDVPVH